MKGVFMKLREFKFRELPPTCGLTIFDGDSEIASGFVGDVLKALPPVYADRDIASSNWYLDTYVIRL
jgi:hypothetical protein